MVKNKLRPIPGPGQYKEDNSKVENGYISKDAKECGFIGDAEYSGAVSPGTKYNPSYVGIDIDKQYARMHKAKISRMDKIVKDPTKPSPGDYDSITAFNKTHLSV
jgi:hypothetical protein